MAEWNSRRLNALLETNLDSLVLAAVRDGRSAELEAFVDRLAKRLKPPPPTAPATAPHPAAAPAAAPPPPVPPADTSEPINLKVVTQDGNEIYFKCKQSTPLQKLMQAFCNRQGVSMESVRFLFDGNRINETRTPEYYEMGDGDTIDVMIEQMCIASPVPALFGTHEHAVGLKFLESAGELARATSQSARAIVQQLGGSLDAAPEVVAKPVLDSSACAALTAFLDARACGAGAPDLRLTLSEQELEALIGARACAAVIAAFGARFDVIRLRRVEAEAAPKKQQLCVAFHTDFSKRTMQVALNAEHEYEGGKLLFATGGGFVQPARPRGTATIHVSACVHGVTALRRGVRYGLFVCDTAAGDARALRGGLRYLEEAVAAQPTFFERALGFMDAATDAQLAACVGEYAAYLASLAAAPRETKAKAPVEGTPGEATPVEAKVPVAEPSFGAELAWRTHLLHPVAYARACARLRGLRGHDRGLRGREEGAEELIDHAPRSVGAYTDGACAVDAPVPPAMAPPNLGLDLVRALRRQQEFMRAVLAEGLPGATGALLDEYIDFLGRVKHSEQPLVPTRAVDLMWHTHMLFPWRYAAECLRLAGSFVDHDDDVGMEVMTGGD